MPPTNLFSKPPVPQNQPVQFIHYEDETVDANAVWEGCISQLIWWLIMLIFTCICACIKKQRFVKRLCMFAARKLGFEIQETTPVHVPLVPVQPLQVQSIAVQTAPVQSVEVQTVQVHPIPLAPAEWPSVVFYDCRDTKFD